MQICGECEGDISLCPKRKVLVMMIVPFRQAVRQVAAQATRSMRTTRALSINSSRKDGVVDLEVGEKGVTLTWEDGEKARFSFIWLRDHDQSALHPTSKQRMINTVSINPFEKPVQADIENGTDLLKLQWPPASPSSAPDTAPTTRFSLSWLKANKYHMSQDRVRKSASGSAGPERPPVSAQAGSLEPPPLRAHGQTLLGAADLVAPETWYGDAFQLQSFDAREDSYEAQQAVLRELMMHGVVHLHHMPEAREDIRSVFQRFGMLRRTFYADDIWDLHVVADADVNDTAMTSIELPPHTDCTYYGTPPGLQLFSCLENNAVGGESWFVDGRAVRLCECVHVCLLVCLLVCLFVCFSLPLFPSLCLSFLNSLCFSVHPLVTMHLITCGHIS